MRFRRLDLVRYGRFTGQLIDLPPATPDLHVVVGPNEAGKSTVQAALGDLLFGIPNRSPLNFLHEYASMRLGAELEAASDRLQFQRRKGRKNTVLDSQGTPIVGEQQALLPFVADANRSFFERMFSLDHERLREGGREILDDRSEFGQTLFAASSGIQDLRGHLTALDDEAKGLWAKHRAKGRRFYQVADRLKAAEQRIREHAVSARQWNRLREVHEGLRRESSALVKEIDRKRVAWLRLSRIRRVYPYVEKKAQLESELARLGTVGDLPSDAGDRLQQAEEDSRFANRRLDDLRPKLASTREQRAELDWDEDLLARSGEIGALQKQRIQLHNEKIDLPKRQRDLEAQRTRLRDLAVEVGWASEKTAGLIERLPTRTRSEHARRVLRSQGRDRSGGHGRGGCAGKGEPRPGRAGGARPKGRNSQERLPARLDTVGGHQVRPHLEGPFRRDPDLRSQGQSRAPLQRPPAPTGNCRAGP